MTTDMPQASSQSPTDCRRLGRAGRLNGTMTKVSIIMAAYNCERYIEKAIRSVLTQTYHDLELVVVDDGSTDGTFALARAISSSDPRLRVLTQPHAGRPAPGRNHALSVASGLYVSFLDADDWYLPGRVGALIEALEANSRWVAAFHDVSFVDQDGNEQPGSYLSNTHFVERAHRHINSIGSGWYECDSTFFVFQSLVYAALHTQSVMIARDRVTPGLLFFDERFRIVDDTDLWIRLGMDGRIGYLDRCMSCYRVHSTSISQNQLRLLEDSAALHRLNYERVKRRITKAERVAYRAKVARYSDELADTYLTNAQDLEARRAYWDAFIWSPSGSAMVNLVKSLLPRPVRDSLRRAAKRWP